LRHKYNMDFDEILIFFAVGHLTVR
jgi:hypothetical protein